MSLTLPDLCCPIDRWDIVTLLLRHRPTASNCTHCITRLIDLLRDMASLWCVQLYALGLSRTLAETHSLLNVVLSPGGVWWHRFDNSVLPEDNVHRGEYISDQPR